MSIIYKVNGVTLTNRVRLLDEGGSFVTAANRGELGTGGVTIDDPGSTLTITGWQTFTVDDDEAFPDNRIFTGYIAERPVGRGGRMVVGSDRTHSCTILDLNALLHVHVLHANAAKRAAESDNARVAYLLTSEALSSLVVDSGLVSSSSPINFLASDLRRSFADDVINAMAPIAGKNFFVYRDPTTGNASLFYDAYQAAVNSSGLKLSNVSTDVDNVTTFGPSMDATDEIQPNEVYSGVSYGWQGAPLYVTSATTAAAFFGGINGRDSVYDTDRVGHLATAQSEAIRYLNVHSTETHFLTCRVVLPSGKATQIKAGQRIQVKFSHLADFTSFTWVRIIRCGARPVAPQFWELVLELWVPQVPVTDALIPAAGIVQTISGQSTGAGAAATFGAPVTAGNLLVIAFAERNGGTAVAATTLSSVNKTDIVGPFRPFTGFGSPTYAVIRTGDAAGADAAAIGYRVATGDEQTLFIGAQNCSFTIWELSGASVTGVEMLSTSSHVASTGKSLGAFSAPGSLQLGVHLWDIDDGANPSQTVGTGWTQDQQTATGSGGPLLHPGALQMHGTAATIATITGTAYEWGGLAIAFPGGGTSLPATGQAIATETPAGTINASNTAFTTAGSFIELPTLTLRVYHDGIDETSHISAYDGTAGTFSLDYAPSYGSVITVQYLST